MEPSTRGIQFVCSSADSLTLLAARSSSATRARPSGETIPRLNALKAIALLIFLLLDFDLVKSYNIFLNERVNKYLNIKMIFQKRKLDI